MPTLAFEEGSRALPVDLRRCRRHRLRRRRRATGSSTAPTQRLPVTAFVHVVDCRRGGRGATEADGADCSGERAGNLYIQYWTLLRRLGDAARHPDRRRRRAITTTTGRAVQVRIGPDGERRPARLLAPRLQLRPQRRQLGLRRRHRARQAKRAEDARRRASATAGARRPGCCSSPAAATPATPAAIADVDRFTPGRRVHLIPLEPIAADRRLDLRDHRRPG